MFVKKREKKKEDGGLYVGEERKRRNIENVEE